MDPSSQSRWLLFITILVTLTQIFAKVDHNCYRECTKNKKDSKICTYNFTLTNDWVLTPQFCGQCPTKRDDCSKENCISVDGTRRGVAVVNKVLPGQSIRVCEGDTVVVDVTNNLKDEETTIHWHGIHQKKTPWMDGVPKLSQCALHVGSTFRYEFDVPIAGTYFWHSHEGVQRADGIAGALIVRKSRDSDVHSRRYVNDLPEHELLIQDWLPKLSPKNPFAGGPLQLMNDSILASTLLINGKGFPADYFIDFKSAETVQSKQKPHVPIEELKIRQNETFRFRIISNGVADCPIEFSIEKHTLQVIASDGFDVKPIEVSSLVIFAGERYDFILNANQKIDSYWIKLRGLLDCEMTKAFQVAVLNYDGAKGLPSHSIKNWEDAAPSSGLQLNALNVAPGDGKKTMSMSELRSAGDDDPEILKAKPDHQFYLAYDYDPFQNIKTKFGIPIDGFPQLNQITLDMPSAPPMVHSEEIHKIKKCSDETHTDCSKRLCKCTHWLKVKLNSIVEFVMIDRGTNTDSSHPFHLHGHSFHVVAQGVLGSDKTPSVVKEMDAKGEIKRTRENAPVKDTVSIPNGGYTIFRFRANNPGYWLFHCHIEFHAALGMGLVLQVGEDSEIPRPPATFPKCPETEKKSPFPFLPSLPPFLRNPK